MAKKEVKVNKTQAIRDALEANPDMSPSRIAEALTNSGIKVSAAYVSTTKSAMKNSKGKKRGAKSHANGRSKSDDLVSLPNLIEARKFVDRLGGIDEAQLVIAALSKLA